MLASFSVVLRAVLRFWRSAKPSWPLLIPSGARTPTDGLISTSLPRRQALVRVDADLRSVRICLLRNKRRKPWAVKNGLLRLVKVVRAHWTALGVLPRRGVSHVLAVERLMLRNVATSLGNTCRAYVVCNDPAVGGRPSIFHSGDLVPTCSG